MKLSWKTWMEIGGIYSPIQCRSLDPKILKKNSKRSLRKSMKRENAKGELLTIVTVCCGDRKVAWIQNLFHLIARLQILPLESWGIAGILFVKTVKPVGRHSTFHMAPVRYTIHLHIMNYIMFTLIVISHGKLWCSTRCNTKCVSECRRLVHTGCNKMHDDCKVMKDHKLHTSFRPKMTGNEGNRGVTAYTMRINIL
jgi:hypothetical protein